MNISDLTGTALNPYIAKALGHVGNCEINFAASESIAIQLYGLHGEALNKWADGHYCTMRHAGKFYTQHAKDPITAIYRAFIVSRLGEEL